MNQLFMTTLICIKKYIFQVDRYKVEIDEKGTRFSDEIDVDENGDEAVFRVPCHNNIDGANVYHDFKMVSFKFSFFRFYKEKLAKHLL